MMIKYTSRIPYLFDEENPQYLIVWRVSKFILDLEEKHLIKLPLDTDNIKKGVNQIKPFKIW